ncbi:RNA polymerase ECF family sigma subunit [Stackebrandtia endophytica]|uniref:RNA polymerase ECF family sigma subunit n=1 Tax=Stackebrandtia endophytica TaxID=1496996 RepID=A0A543AVT3_9ACTN|nr:RNA polymerase sigma factor SigJ [Stackebrandtia endophytica]TQL76687.1 RNA polymerase ECF family sigma subunit [Stackebrandtia endophytica]
MDTATMERFEANRSRLASIAYRLLGSAADAEDAVQDAFLRWQAADHGHIDVPEAWLTKVVTNLALDRLRSAKVRRERAVGAWMPEPLLEGDPMLDPAETVEQRESVTLAVLTLMERLPPVERAVYVLFEAFSYRHAEIAEILDITESASQQHVHRARRHVAAERTRADVDRVTAHRVVSAFVDAAASGETERLVALLTDDAVSVSDGAGGTAAKLMVLTAPEQVANALRIGYKPTSAKRRLVGGAPSLYSTVLNGSPAMVVALDDRVVAVVVLDLRDGRIATVRGMANPARFERLSRIWQPSRDGSLVLDSW